MANKFEQVVTDTGIARYPWLNYPEQINIQNLVITSLA